ncbi:MerR family transcriptional regulator [Zavarzinia sp. CC-PAN008]|uniref:MerR family transcriptional regulator n=1 Tax=Zavarzinia sp. CC-PAN008 TaxID=3243332 RepID=UPI003F742D80
MSSTELSLSELAAASGVEARTIRSWVAQDLLPAPLSRGPTARYPADMLDRVLAVRAMRDGLGMPLAEIRKELLVATPDQIRAHAERGRTMAALGTQAPPPAASASSALDYIASIRSSRIGPASVQRSFSASLRAPPHEPQVTLQDDLSTLGIDGLQASVDLPRIGFEALEQRLAQPGATPARKARAEDWLRIPITPDVELSVRGTLDPEQRTRLERCADLIRDILLGRNT